MGLKSLTHSTGEKLRLVFSHMPRSRTCGSKKPSAKSLGRRVYRHLLDRKLVVDCVFREQSFAHHHDLPAVDDAVVVSMGSAWCELSTRSSGAGRANRMSDKDSAGVARKVKNLDA